MRTETKSGGYTIVEVMIFLAISGFMFAASAVFISGKQSNAQFKQGMNDVNTELRGVIDNVANGFYPSNSNFKCVASGGKPTITTVTNTQGSNKGCVFIGKIIQFNTYDASGSNRDGTNYSVYSVAGLQSTDDTGTTLPTSFKESAPTIINRSDVTETIHLHWGVELVKAYEGSASNTISGIGFFGSFRSGDASASGSQTVLSVAVPVSTDTNKQGKIDEVAAFVGNVSPGTSTGDGKPLDDATAAKPNPKVTLCFKGGGDHYAAIYIGDDNSQRLTTRIQTGNSLSQLGCA
jgi:hypothetical protein